MQNAKSNVLETIGDTPIVKLGDTTKDISSEIFVKLEFMNPGGSIKDRIGFYILQKAIKKGLLKKGGTIIEGTSGNTGVGLAMFAAVHGYKCVFVLADKQSCEKIDNLKAFGAKVIVCPSDVPPEDPRSYYSVSEHLSQTIPNSYYVNQYNNLLNREAHYHFTGPEIYNQTGGDFDVLMAGVGTGGTITGCAMYLKKKMPHLQVVGVDCEGSIIAHYAKTGEITEARSYKIEGIGEDFIPDNYDFSLIDDFVTVGDKESFLMARRLLKKEGLYSGGSSGAAVAGAVRYAKRLKEKKKILVILPDSGNRYASKIYNDDWMTENSYFPSSLDTKVGDLLDKIGRKKIIAFKDKGTVGEAVCIMDKENVSHLPVYQKGKIRGVVSRSQLLYPILNGHINSSDSVSLIWDTLWEQVDKNTPLCDVTDVLLKKQVLLVMEDENPIHFLTPADLLRHTIQKTEV